MNTDEKNKWAKLAVVFVFGWMVATLWPDSKIANAVRSAAKKMIGEL